MLIMIVVSGKIICVCWSVAVAIAIAIAMVMVIVAFVLGVQGNPHLPSGQTVIGHTLIANKIY